MAKPQKRKGAKGPQSAMDKSIDRIEASILKWQDRLFDLWKVVFKKIASRLKATVSFIAKVVKNAATLVATVGKKAVKMIESAGNYIETVLQRVPVLVKKTMRFGAKVLDIIARGGDPKRLVGTLKRMVTRYVNMVREIYRYVLDFMTQLDVLGMALTIVNTFKNVLRLVVSWIVEVSGADSAVRKAKSLLRKVVKALKIEIRDAIKMGKEASRLKPA